MPLVSIVMTTYNHEKYLDETIKSVLHQTFDDYEFIIINNGSTDNTAEILKTFSDPRLSIHHVEKNKGGVPAMNQAISLAKGKYIAILCSDDVFCPEKLQKQVDFLDKHSEIGIVFTRVKIIDENSQDFSNPDHFYSTVFEQPNRSRHEWLNHFFFQGNCLCFPSALIRKEVFETIGLINPCFAQLPDFDFWIRTCLKFDIHIIQEKLTQFRVRDNEMNESGNRWENIVRCEWELGEIIKHFFTFSTLDELLNVFPELKNQYAVETMTDTMIHYYLAQLCLNKPISCYKALALERLYRLLQTSEPELSTKYHFSYPEFFKLVADTDIYKAVDSKCKTKLESKPNILDKISKFIKCNTEKLKSKLISTCP